MKVVIVKDKKLSAKHLSLLLHRIDSNIHVLHYFDSVKTTTKAFEKGLKNP